MIKFSMIDMQIEKIKYKEKLFLIKIVSSKKYKNLIITVEPKFVRISKPLHVSNKKAMRFLLENIDKIYNKYGNLYLNHNNTDILDDYKLLIKGKEVPLILKSTKNDDDIKLIISENNAYFYVSERLNKIEKYNLFCKYFKEYLRNETEKILNERLKYWSKLLNENYNKVSIKCQRTIWGSAVIKKRNLNFNMKIAMLPINVYDYIIIHELCHFKEANHSQKFWKQVEKYDKYYKEHIQYLKQNANYFNVV